MRPVAITTLCTMVLFLHGGFLKAGEERSVIDEIPELAQALKFMEAGEHERGEKLFARGEARLRDLIQGALKNDRKAAATWQFQLGLLYYYEHRDKDDIASLKSAAEGGSVWDPTILQMRSRKRKTP